jgi:glycosyltransferase involved in cell wall biosynthesis
MWASAGGRLRRAIRELRPDCLISYWVHPDGEVATRAAREAGIPSSVIVGGSDVLILPNQSVRRRKRVLSVLHATDAIVTVGGQLRDHVIGLGLPADKVHVVYQGVDPRQFCPGDRSASRRSLGITEDVPTLLFVGNLVPVKGLEVLLGACALLRERGTAFRLYLVGDGPQRAALEARGAQLGLSDVVTFVGAIAQPQLPNWYRAADLTVLASHSEGIPNVLRESMACGTPFVATRVGGIHEISGDCANRLVPPGDQGALAEAIRASLSGPLPAVGSGTGTWEESAERLLDVMRPLTLTSSNSGPLDQAARPGVESPIHSAV